MFIDYRNDLSISESIIWLIAAALAEQKNFA